MYSNGLNNKFAQVNVHHAKGASALIARIFTKNHLSMVLIQEPWHYKGGIRGLSCNSGKVIWDNRHTSPRACILIRKGINYFCLTEFMTRDLVPIKVQMDIEDRRQELVVASAYFPGEDTLPLWK